MRYLIFVLPLGIACAAGDGIKTELGDNAGIAIGDGLPNIELNTEVLDFGDLAFGDFATETVVINNNGTGTLTVSNINISNPFSSMAAGEITIQPGTSTPISIQFQADNYGAASGTLTLTSDDADEPQVVVNIMANVITDMDNDGYESIDAGGTDCQDDDPDIYPGAPDEWYDGVDSNCMGDDDYDQDGDGFKANVQDIQDDTLDCQDANPDIYPGAPDEWYDGVDSNCDGRDDFDQDGDGSRSLAEGRGSDCDDFDAYINTGASERLNGKDDNCDDLTDNDVAGWDADKTYYGTSASDQAGFQITLGDLDEDGNDDLVIGSPGYGGGRGHVAIFSGDNLPADGSNIEFGANDFPGINGSDKAGFYVGVYDNFTGEQIPSLLVGVPGYNNNQGRVYFIDGSEAFYGGNLEDAYLTITGTSSSKLGSGFTQNLDLNGDGLEDIYGFYASGSNSYLYLHYGGNQSGDVTLNDVDARFSTSSSASMPTGESTDEQNSAENMQRSFPNGGDINGDGLTDALFCGGDIDHSYDSRQGSVWVLWGQSTNYSNSNPESLGSINSSGTLSGAGDLILSGDNVHGSGQACGIGPDWNEDGTDEVWVFYPGGNGTYTGLYMIPGSTDLEGYHYHTREAYSHYVSTRTSNPVTGVRKVGDWNGDGKGEVAVSFAQASFNSTADGGLAWILYSDLEEGDHSGSDVAANIEGDADYNQSKYGNTLLSRPGDLNGDGHHDWVASDWGFLGTSGSTPELGAIYINYNESQ